MDKFNANLENEQVIKMTDIKIGIIGLGAIAEKVHLKNLKDMAHVTIAAVTDVDLDRAKQIANSYNITHYFTDVTEMIEQVELDGVIICTPNSTHMPIASIVAEKGIHIFMEKPIGIQLDEVRDYLKIAKEKNVHTMVGMPYRFRRDVEITKSYVDENKLGDIYYAKAKLYRRRGSPKGWFTNKELAGGGALMDIGVHMLDLAWYLLGEPEVETISGHTVTGLGNYETKYTSTWESTNKNLNIERVFDVDDFASAWIRFKNGTVLSLEVSWAVNGEQNNDISVELFGDQGGASLAPLTIYEEENGLLSENKPLFDETNYFHAEMEHFIHCIRTGSQPLVSGEQGFEILKMLKAIYESSETGREVRFDD